MAKVILFLYALGFSLIGWAATLPGAYGTEDAATPTLSYSQIGGV